MSIVSCKEPDCHRKVQARGMCSTHYSYWHRANTTLALTCNQCGGSFTHNRADKATCSTACHQAYTRQTEGWKNRAIAPPRQAKPKPPKRTEAERLEAKRNSRSAIRAAYEDREWSTLIEAIKDDSVVTDAECWEWSRKSRDNYPVVIIAGKWHQVHRLSLHAKHGKPLGVLAAHHACANSMCVNPEHLQPVTHRENVAEMLARTSLEARIKELELALQSVAPGHEVLNRIQAAA